MAEAPAEVPRPLSDLGALAERPLSTCTLNDQLERTHASRVGGGCPRPPPGSMAGCSIAAKDSRLIAPPSTAESHAAVAGEGQAPSGQSPRERGGGIVRTFAGGSLRATAARRDARRPPGQTGQAQPHRPRGAWAWTWTTQTDTRRHSWGHGRTDAHHELLTRGATLDMHPRRTRLEGRLPGMRGASLLGSTASRGTVARQSFAPPPRRGGETQQHPPDRSRQFASGLCAGEGRSSAPTDTPGAVMMGDLVVLLADLVAVMRQPARARSGEVV